ncbi:hypothetical protein [Cryobacterium fucosi]|uniref:hypothetical protein n=1 Tax=Cryobacterium fucosi TaxID=1259157 RepID=UPI00106D5DC2|nr:hypothetical protein [Cryobacterium fucosi]
MLKNINQVARKFKMSRTTVKGHLERRGIDIPSKRMTTADIDQAIQLYGEGKSSMVIGKQLGFDNHTILKALKLNDVVIRKQLGR